VVALLPFLAHAAFGQMAQNPSPMVEHRREHPRIAKGETPGRREGLTLGTLFVPASLKLKRTSPVLFFFHGGTWLPETASHRRRIPVVTIQIGAGSGAYTRAFSEPDRFLKLLAEVESKLGVPAGRVTLAGWSAGCGAIRQILRDPASYQRVANVLAIDGIHTGYTDRRELEREHLEMYAQLARDALARKKQLLITHSEIFPGTFASTTETADWLIKELKLKAVPVLRWGPMRTQQLSEVRQGRFELRGYAGNSAPDHVDQLHSLADYLKWFRPLR
jgi:hypothetical protein